MTVVDANVFITGLLTGEARHHASVRWLARQSELEAPILIPSLALAEVAGALARRLSSPLFAVRAVQRIIHLPGLTVVSLDHDIGMQAAELAAILKLRGADATYVAVARVARQPLATWDQEMMARAAPVVEIVRPET